MARNAIDRRRYRRIQATIHCRQAGVEFFALHMVPADISFGGLRTYSDQEFAVGAYLRLDMFFPPAEPVIATAEVIWIRASAKGAPARFDVGLALVGLSHDALKLLRPLLESEEGEPQEAAESKADLPAPAESGVDIDSEEEPPAGERGLAAPPPATVRRGRDPRSMFPLVPVIVAGAEKLRTVRLDGRAGFLISLIDGVTTVESLLDLSGMPTNETLGMLEDLRLRGIVELRRGTQES